MANSETFHLGKFTLDVRERRLLRGSEVVRLSPKAYDVLVALVEQRGRLVTKEDLLKRLWPESFVEHGNAGRLDEAFDCLDQAIGFRDPALVHLAVAPDWDSLRGGPRFAERRP